MVTWTLPLVFILLGSLLMTFYLIPLSLEAREKTTLTLGYSWDSKTAPCTLSIIPNLLINDWRPINRQIKITINGEAHSIPSMTILEVTLTEPKVYRIKAVFVGDMEYAPSFAEGVFEVLPAGVPTPAGTETIVSGEREKPMYILWAGVGFVVTGLGLVFVRRGKFRLVRKWK